MDTAPSTDAAGGPAAAGGEGFPGGWESAWEQALVELELDVARAEELLAHPDRHQLAAADRTRWTPPTLGPLPQQLATRARTLLQRQLDVAQALAAAATVARRELALLDRVEPGRPPRRPVYVDAGL